MEYGEVNQTSLISFCGLNINKHISLLETMEDNQSNYKNLITREGVSCDLQVCSKGI